MLAPVPCDKRHPCTACANTTPARLQLLEAIKPLKRGLAANEEDKARVEALAKALERRNPTKKPLASGALRGGWGVGIRASFLLHHTLNALPLSPTTAPELLSGQWELLYTTSEFILGASKPAFLRPSGPIYQIIGGCG